MSWRNGAAAAGPNACPSTLGQLERVAGEVELAEQLEERPAEDEGEVGGIRVREVGACRAAHGDHHGCGNDESAGEEAQPYATLGFSP